MVTVCPREENPICEKIGNVWEGPTLLQKQLYASINAFGKEKKLIPFTRQINHGC